MPPTTLPPPAYSNRAYQLCDVFDAIAQNVGDQAADLCVRRLLGQTVKEYPRAARTALGATDAAVYLATYKATAAPAGDPIDQLGQQFLTLLRAAGDDEARTWLEDAIAEMQADDGEPAQPAMQPSAKVTDSGLMSAQKAVKPYQPAHDPYAVASAADQLDHAARVAGVDLRPR